MAKDWHRNVTQGLVDAVNMIVSDYKGEKDANAKATALKEKEKLALKKEGDLAGKIDGTGSGPYMPLDKKKGASKGGSKAGDYSKGYRPEESGDAAAYKKFFEKALKKFDVSSPDELKGEKKKEFFDYVDKNWTADHEEEVQPEKKKVEVKKEEPKKAAVKKEEPKKLEKAAEKNEENCKSCGSPISKVKKEEKPAVKPAVAAKSKKEEKEKEKQEAKNIKLSGKQEKVKLNPTAKAEAVQYAMGDNPFQRVIQSQKKALTEAFQHSWGYGTPEEAEYREQWMTRFHEYVAAENPHVYVDMLQVKSLYSVGSGPEEAAERVLGYRTEQASDYRRRRRLVHGQDDGGNTDEY